MSPFRTKAWRRLAAHRMALFGLVLVAVLILCSLAVPLFFSASPRELTGETAFLPPSLAHWFGTDDLGRDLLLRTFAGGRISLFVAFVAVGFSLVIGVPLGLVAGYFGGFVDSAVMRLVDLMLSFPSILLAIVLVTAFGGASLQSLVLSVGIVGIPQFARQVRGEVLALREREFVLAARALGLSRRRILFRHLLPNALGPLTVLTTLRVGTAILEAAGLSFLGLGVEVDQAEWGTMIKAGRETLSQSPWIAIFPGLALSMTVLGFNLFGDGLRDLLDPRERR
ncbi:MAG: ABC transporter permease [Planctomycetota bacterium]